MSNLNTIERGLLMKAALNPQPKKTWADYKKEQRRKTQERTVPGKLYFSAESTSMALLDALSELVRSGNTSEPISTVIKLATARFPIPTVAEVSIKQRMMVRKSKHSKSEP